METPNGLVIRPAASTWELRRCVRSRFLTKQLSGSNWSIMRACLMFTGGFLDLPTQDDTITKGAMITSEPNGGFNLAQARKEDFRPLFISASVYYFISCWLFVFLLLTYWAATE